LRGASNTLRNPELKALVVEVNGSGKRYGFGNQEIFDCLDSHGFERCTYDPFSRNLSSKFESENDSRNALFVRDIDWVQERVLRAPQRVILGEKI
jgi:hypothetical protein